MSWYIWWALEIGIGILIVVAAWPLSFHRLVLTILLAMLFSCAYHMRVNTKNAEVRK
jgi:hypothetical protein